MAAKVLGLTAGGQSGDGSRAAAKIPLNNRVRVAAGFIGVVPEVMQFPGPSVIGNWSVGATRVKIMGLPVVNESSAGTSFGPPPPMPSTGPMQVAQPDGKVSAQ